MTSLRELDRRDRNDTTDFLLLLTILGVAFIGGCHTVGRFNDLEKKIDRLTPNSRTENVIGGEALETFYEIDGRRTYLKIDGKPVEDYVSAK